MRAQLERKDSNVANSSLIEKLLKYKNATSKDRIEMLQKERQLINKLSKDEPTDNETKVSRYRDLVNAKELIKYANNLYKIENQQPFEVLVDYNQMQQHLSDNCKDLLDYFNFSSSPDGRQAFMTYKKPLTEYTQDIWNQFHDAQCTYLQKKGILKSDANPKGWAVIQQGVA